MQRAILRHSQPFIGRSRLLFVARRPVQILRSAHHSAAEAARRPTAAEIKKNVPNLWVRKMRTFFAFYDKNDDGIVNDQDYKTFIDICVSNASCSKEQIEKFRTKMHKLWIDEVAGGNDKFVWTENKYLEDMFALVSRPGAEEFVRDAATEIFKLFDYDGDDFLTKDELKAILGGNPFSIVSFAAMDTNRIGKVSRKEFVDAHVDFWFNFADETRPSKHSVIGPLLN